MNLMVGTCMQLSHVSGNKLGATRAKVALGAKLWPKMGPREKQESS